MADLWPHFEFKLLSYQRSHFGVWKGRVQPIKRTEGVGELLDDLDHDREVRLAGDEILHLTTCTADHVRAAWVERIIELRKPFDLEVHYDGSRAPPRCYVLFPVILTWKHMWHDWSICDSLASQSWTGTETVADAMPDYLIWLVKWMVYDQTGKWIGAEHESTPEYHLANVKPDDPCWCRSGRLYGECDRERDKMLAKLKQRRN